MRPTADQPICWALAAMQPASEHTELTRSGNITPHSKACMAPIEPPITVSHRLTPRWSASRRWVRTMSRTVTVGNDEP